MTRNALLVALAVLAATALYARDPVDNDPGPPYQFKIVDIVFRVENIGGVVQDIQERLKPLAEDSARTANRASCCADSVASFMRGRSSSSDAPESSMLTCVDSANRYCARPS